MTAELIEQNLSRIQQTVAQTAGKMDLSLNKYVYQNRYNKILNAIHSVAKKVSPSNVFDTDVCPYNEKEAGQYHLAQRVTFGPGGVGVRDPTNRGSHSYLYDPKQIVEVLLLDPKIPQGIMNWLIANNKMKGLKEWNEIMQTIPTLQELSKVIRMGQWEDKRNLDSTTYFQVVYGNINGDESAVPIKQLHINTKASGDRYDNRIVMFNWYKEYSKQPADITFNAGTPNTLLVAVKFLTDENLMHMFEAQMEKLATHNSILISPEEKDRLTKLFEKVENQLAVALLTSAI